jgi:hypothetical protein
MRFHGFIAVLLAAACAFTATANAQSFSSKSIEIPCYGKSPHTALTTSGFTCLTGFGNASRLEGRGRVHNSAICVFGDKVADKEVTLTSPEFDEPLPAFAFTTLGDSLYAFTSLYEDDMPVQLFACTLDPKTLKQVGTPKMVMEYIDDFTFRTLEGSRIENPLILSSPDKHSIFIAAAETKDDRTTLHGMLLGEGLKTILDKKFFFEFDLEKILVSDFQLTNDGQIVFMGFEGAIMLPSATVKWLDRSRFHVFTLEKENRIAFDHVINLIFFFPLNAKAVFLPDGNLVCAGLYATEDKMNIDKRLAAGVFSVTYAPASTTPLSSKITPFTADYIAGAIQEPGLGRQPTKGLAHLVLKGLIAGADGYVYLLSEHAFYDRKERGNYNEINIMALQNGKVEWTSRIYKRQVDQVIVHGSGPLFSFSSFMRNDKLHIFYNDDSQNAMDLHSAAVRQYEGNNVGHLVCAVVEAGGEVHKYVAHPFDVSTPIPLPLRMSQSSPNSFNVIAIPFSAFDVDCSLVRINIQ